MQGQLLIKNANVVNEGKLFLSDVLIQNGIIERIAPMINKIVTEVIDGSGLLMFPGVIDGHVHFREPGLTYKADIYSESAAAIAGGVTSYLDMPNTVPNTTSRSLLANKYRLASGKSFANYGFYFGVTRENAHEVTLLSEDECCAVSDDGLYFTNQHSLLVEQPDLLLSVLNSSPKLVAIHSEFESMVARNLQEAIKTYGDDIPINMHSQIRDEASCYEATKRAVSIAARSSGRLHILHVSTAKEVSLFATLKSAGRKSITSEVCIQHLYFSDEDYYKLGARIKWNPSIKSFSDKMALLTGLRNGIIDVVSTDHAPHLASEKEALYARAPGGGPMVQHSLVAMLELVKENQLTLERIADLMCHNPADIYGLKGRGYVREGYFADLILVDMADIWQVRKDNILSKCGWSAFEGRYFSSKVKYTIVNGHICYRDDEIVGKPRGIRLEHYV